MNDLLERIWEMKDIGEYMAPFRTAVWFTNLGDYKNDMGRVWKIIRELSLMTNWDEINPAKVPVLALRFGSIVNHRFTLRKV